jgi:glucose-6-phosphate isomerase
MEIITEGTTHIPETHVEDHLAALANYRDVLRTASEDTTYASPEASLAAPLDVAVIDHAIALSARFRPTLQTILLVGIGGSDLGTRAIYDALKGHLQAFDPTETPTLLPFGTVEPRVLTTIRTVLERHERVEEVVLMVISKSGGTAETLTNANVLFATFAERFGREAASKQTIVISDADTPLAHAAAEQGMTHVPIPHTVGGRFSVFTAVGLVPLALLGVDIRALCEGAAAGAHASVASEGPSAAMVLASLLYEEYQRGIELHETFFFDPELETLGKWYRQLLAESLGKERADGTPVGIMPTVALCTDLHSLGQLVFGGPRNRFTTFVAAPATWRETPRVTADPPFVIPMIANKESGAIIQAIYEGVRVSYQAHGLDFIRIELAAITERELGAFMAVQMAAVMYLGKLFAVNTFDQPNVESYKTETKRILSA